MSSNTTWHITRHNQKNKYQSSSSTIIREIQAGTPHVDTVQLETYFTIELQQQETPTTLSGYTDSARITRKGTRTVEVSNVQSENRFVGRITVNELIFNPATNPPDCSSLSTLALGEIRPAIITHPSSLSLNSTWADSVLATTCNRNGIPTTIKNIRTYQVLGEVSRSMARILVLKRMEIIHFIGTGSQQQHQIEIEGSGSGSSIIYMDITSGVLTELEDFQKLETTIKTSGRVHHYTQEIRQKASLVP